MKRSERLGVDCFFDTAGDGGDTFDFLRMRRRFVKQNLDKGRTDDNAVNTLRFFFSRLFVDAESYVKRGVGVALDG
jgi:hypothetical protein